MGSIDYKHNWYTQMKPDYKKFDADSPFWEMTYQDRWDQMVKLLGHQNNVSVLDIGCGLGRALSYFKKYGAKVTGVEPSNYAIENNRLSSDELIHDSFADAKIAVKYDVVHIEQVLSHIPDYQGTLKKAVELLNPGGVLVIEEPNDNNALQRILEAKYGKYWATPDHCNYFNFDLLSEALIDSGLTPKVRSATYPMEFFLFMGFDYIGDDEMGKMIHKFAEELLTGIGSVNREKLLQGYAEQGLGRDCVIYAVKAGG